MNKKLLIITSITVTVTLLLYIFLASKNKEQELISIDEITEENFDSYCKRCREENPYCFSCCDVTLPDGETLICQ